MLSRRDFLKLGGAALLTTAFGRLNLVQLDASPAPVIYHGSRNYPTIAVTFDDDWHPEVLDQLIEMVKPYPNFRLTFFAIGDAILIDEALSPGVWKRIAQNGHEIGYHTFHHVDPAVMSPKALIADFDQWMNTLQQVLGFRPTVHFAKPPYDDLSPSFLTLCKERNLVATLYSLGYEATTVDEGLNLAAKTQNGDIVQMHTYQDPNQGRFDVAITEKVLPYLAGQGFTLVTLSTLYDQLLQDQYNSPGCNAGTGASLTRTCIEP